MEKKRERNASTGDEHTWNIHSYTSYVVLCVRKRFSPIAVIASWNTAHQTNSFIEYFPFGDHNNPVNLNGSCICSVHEQDIIRTMVATNVQYSEST